MTLNQEKWKRVFKKNESIVARKIADEMLLVPIKGKLADMQRIFSLNPVAEYIWEQLDGKRSLKDIRNGVLAVFGVGEKQADSDIFQFIDELEQAELIVGVE